MGVVDREQIRQIKDSDDSRMMTVISNIGGMTKHDASKIVWPLTSDMLQDFARIGRYLYVELSNTDGTIKKE